MSVPQQLSSFNNQIPPRYAIKSITKEYQITGADYGRILNCSGTASFTLSVAPAASLGAGFNCWIWNTTSTISMQITVDPNGAETIDGRATLVLYRGTGTQLICDGLNWQVGEKKTMRLYAENYTPSSNNMPAALGNDSIALGYAYVSGDNAFSAINFSNNGSVGAFGGNSIAIGTTTSAVANYSSSIGYANNANWGYTLALGRFSSADFQGAFTWCSSPFGTWGDAQYSLATLIATTGGSVAAMTTDGAAINSINQFKLATNQAVLLTGTLVGKQTGTANIATYTITVNAVNNGGTVTVPTATITLFGTDSIGLTTSPTITADNTNKAITVTSGAKTATSVNWVCTLSGTQVVY